MKRAARSIKRRTKEHVARSRAARKGWETRRRNAAKRSRAAKKAAKTRAARKGHRYDYLVTVSFNAPSSGGIRHYSRSLVVPALFNSSHREILANAKREAPTQIQSLIANAKLGAVEISRGPRSTRKRSEER